MYITIKLYGNLRRFLPNKRETAEMELRAGTTIADLLEQLHVPDGEVWMSAVNDDVVPASTVLEDRDLLEVFEPVGGGTIGAAG